jgi:hypothetical protein
VRGVGNNAARTRFGRHALLALFAAVFGCSDGPPPPPPITWTPLFEGVDFRREEKTKAWDATDARIQRVSALRIDLTSDVAFATPEKSVLPPAPGQQHVSTTGRTLTDSLNFRADLSVGISGSFFWPCCDDDEADPTAMSLFGLNVNDGVAVSSYSLPETLEDESETTNVPDATWVGATALVITRDKRAQIVEATAAHPLDIALEDIEAAVAGGPNPDISRCPVPGECDLFWPPQRPVQAPNHSTYPLRLVQNGKTFYSQDDWIAGRTAAGVSADGRLLYLVTIDGGADGAIPPEGASFYDAARWMQHFGAHNALNLEGGGSTTMAMGTDGNVPDDVSCPVNGRAVPLNVPYGDRETRCRERLLGSFLGVVAPPLP